MGNGKCNAAPPVRRSDMQLDGRRVVRTICPPFFVAVAAGLCAGHVASLLRECKVDGLAAVGMGGRTAVPASIVLAIPRWETVILFLSTL